MQNISMIVCILRICRSDINDVKDSIPLEINDNMFVSHMLLDNRYYYVYRSKEKFTNH
jgi:hypothetical protein